MCWGIQIPLLRMLCVKNIRLLQVITTSHFISSSVEGKLKAPSSNDAHYILKADGPNQRMDLYTLSCTKCRTGSKVLYTKLTWSFNRESFWTLTNGTIYWKGFKLRRRDLFEAFLMTDNFSQPSKRCGVVSAHCIIKLAKLIQQSLTAQLAQINHL